jgi:hypothetical protein
MTPRRFWKRSSQRVGVLVAGSLSTAVALEDADKDQVVVQRDQPLATGADIYDTYMYYQTLTLRAPLTYFPNGITS